MKSIIIYHHLGLGDHFMCHGIIREYAKQYSHVGVFALERNYPTTAFMFRDLPNVRVIEGNDVTAKKYIAEGTTIFPDFTYDEALILGFEHLDRNSGVLLENQFYTRAKVDIHKKWDNFHVERDLKKEQGLFDQYAPKTPYVFLHEDTLRSYLIERKLIPTQYTIFTPNPQMTANAFDLCTIIERASEIHVIDSSFMFMIDCLSYSNPSQKLFVHRYSRENEDWKLPTLRKPWHVYWMSDHFFGFAIYLRKRLTEYKGRIRSKFFPTKKHVVIA